MSTEKEPSPTQTETIENAPHIQDRHRGAEFEAPMQHIQQLNEAEHINLSWRSWLVVFVTCFAIMAQVFVVVAAGSVIAFIIRDLGDGAIAGWIIRSYPVFFLHCRLLISLLQRAPY
jgi:hypothetical protein